MFIGAETIDFIMDIFCVYKPACMFLLSIEFSGSINCMQVKANI